jgi:hypothetical protein
VIAVWSRFTESRLRLGSSLSGHREGLAAEIALAFRPDAIVVTGELHGIPVAVAGNDQIAVELVARALASLISPNLIPDVATGPWEAPLVQRATELGLGVTLPSQITLVPHWAGPASDSSFIPKLIGQLERALGIPRSPRT